MRLRGVQSLNDLYENTEPMNDDVNLFSLLMGSDPVSFEVTKKRNGEVQWVKKLNIYQEEQGMGADQSSKRLKKHCSKMGIQNQHKFPRRNLNIQDQNGSKRIQAA